MYVVEENSEVQPFRGRRCFASGIGVGSGGELAVFLRAEVGDLLPHTILEDLEIVGGETGNFLSFSVFDHHFDRGHLHFDGVEEEALLGQTFPVAEGNRPRQDTEDQPFRSHVFAPLFESGWTP